MPPVFIAFHPVPAIRPQPYIVHGRRETNVGRTVLIAMAGLPGTGKSTLAARLAAAIDGVVLCKDVVRAALFPPAVLDYSPAQDDVAMTAIYDAAALIMGTEMDRHVILDGRTFSQTFQIHALIAKSEELMQRLAIIECVCSEKVVRERLDRDRAAGTHPAGNRTFELYQEVKARSQKITVPRLTLDTGKLSLDTCVARAIEYVNECNLRM